jgi:hypothetical protein
MASYKIIFSKYHLPSEGIEQVADQVVKYQVITRYLGDTTVKGGGGLRYAAFLAAQCFLHPLIFVVGLAKVSRLETVPINPINIRMIPPRGTIPPFTPLKKAKN